MARWASPGMRTAGWSLEIATDLMMQTLTDNDGRSPAMEFEGITDRTVYEGYLIRIVGVLPYPEDLSTTIQQSDYRVSFVVTKK